VTRLVMIVGNLNDDSMFRKSMHLRTWCKSCMEKVVAKKGVSHRGKRISKQRGPCRECGTGQPVFATASVGARSREPIEWR
jgi:hypothetical protein